MLSSWARLEHEREKSNPVLPGIIWQQPVTTGSSEPIFRFPRVTLPTKQLVAAYGVSAAGLAVSMNGCIIIGAEMAPCDFGYAITCHKARDSERDTVVVIYSAFLGGDEKHLQQRWLYTAVSRAKHWAGIYLPPGCSLLESTSDLIMETWL